MNPSEKLLNCPQCDSDLSESSGIVCPNCSLLLRSDLDDGEETVSLKKSTRAAFHRFACFLWFFAPPVAGLASAIFREENVAVISFYVSPFFGAAAGIHLGIHLYEKFGYSRWYCPIYSVVGAIVCPALTFGGCALGFRA